MLSSKYYKMFAGIFVEAKDKEDLIDRCVDFFRMENPLFNEEWFREYMEQLERVLG